MGACDACPCLCIRFPFGRPLLAAADCLCPASPRSLSCTPTRSFAFDFPTKGILQEAMGKTEYW